MADSKTNIVDEAADTANSWWAWLMSYVPEKWKRYVVLVLVVLSVLWFLPTLVGVVKDTMGYLYSPAQTSDFELKARGTMQSHAEAIVDLSKRVDALEKAKSIPPPLTTGSTNKLKQR